MLKRFLPLITFTLVCFQVFSQGNKYKSYKYEWPAEKPRPIAVEEQFKNEDVVILEESSIVNLVTFSHSKKIRLKYLTAEGVKNHSAFTLPTSYDPQGDESGVPFWHKDSMSRPLGEHNSIIYFASRIIKPDGTVTEGKLSEDIERFSYYFNKINQSYFSWDLSVNGISAGDEVEVAYAYIGTFNEYNFFNRIFFNGKIAKQNYELKVRYPNSSLFFFQNHNGVHPPDTGVYKGTNPNSVEYTWKAKNLKGCIAEKKSRPYLELPYVSFYAHQNDYGTMSANRAYIEKSLPYPWEFIFLGNNNYLQKTDPGYVNYLPENVKLRLSKIDDETVSVRNLVERTCASDSNKALCFSKIHNMITDSFDYSKNFDPQREYMNEDYSKVHQSINKKNLKEQDRIDLYDRICIRLGMDYWHCRLYDKRFDSMNYDLYYPCNLYNLYYVLPYKNTYFFFYPKKSRTGYYANELPFYFEDVNTMLIPQTVANTEKNSPVKDIVFPRIATPFSTISDNTRSTNVMCNISLGSKTAVFETRLNLGGQFSTLTRGLYLYGEMDSTLEAYYYQPVYSLSSSSKLISKEMTSHKTTFPYECNFKLKYTDDNVVTSPQAGTHHISLKNWLNNLYDNSLETRDRVMAYYPDFSYSDIHRYMIKFDKPADITNIADFNFKEENSYGKYVVTLKPADDSSYMLETTLLVNATKVEAANIADVKKIFEHIDRMNQSKLVLKEK